MTQQLVLVLISKFGCSNLVKTETNTSRGRDKVSEIGKIHSRIQIHNDFMCYSQIQMVTKVLIASSPRQFVQVSHHVIKEEGKGRDSCGLK